MRAAMRAGQGTAGRDQGHGLALATAVRRVFMLQLQQNGNSN